MLRDLVKDYYDENTYDLNCAECLLWAANDTYDLGLTPESMRLISAFGGGFCCERTCGALCGSIAALSKLLVHDRAHNTDGLKEACTELVDKFEQELHSSICAKLKELYRTEENRCLKTVQLAADVLESHMQQYLTSNSEP